MNELIIFGVVNIITTILSGASGGGGGMMIAPLMVVLGLNPVTAIGTAKFAGFGINVGASARFRREKILDIKSAFVFVIIGISGAIIGSLLLIEFKSHEELIQKLMGYVILLIGLPLLYARNLGIEPKKRSAFIKNIGYVLMLAASVLASAVGSGVAAIHMFILMGFFGMTALKANIAKRTMQLAATGLSVIIFVIAGFVDYRFAVVALTTSILGGYIGAHIAIKKGNKFVVNLFAAMSLSMALLLIFR